MNVRQSSQSNHFLGIAGAIIVKDGRILMVQQGKHGRVFWNFPGGHIEENETPEDTCAREVKEETGYDVTLGGLVYEEEEKFIFLAEISGGSFRLEEGLLGHAWVSPDDPEKWDSKSAKIRDAYMNRCSGGKPI